MWNTISGVTALGYIFEIGIILSSGCLLLIVIMLRRSDRRLAKVRNSSFDLSTKRLKSIESAAGDIRKELLEVQQQRDILTEKLKLKKEEIKKLHSVLDETVKKNAELKQTSKDCLINDSNNQEITSEQSLNNRLDSPLNREQREQLIALLEPGPKGDVDILSVIGDDRSNLLAHELNEIFKADGWTTKGVAQSAFSKVPEGIVLSVHSKETAPSYASFIQRTMATIGFSVSAAVNNKYREWSLTLIIGKMS
jgi:hypothetical protein